MTQRLTVKQAQAQALPALQRLTASGKLTSNLSTFLLFGKAEGLSPATIKDYQYKIGAFVNFCFGLQIETPQDVTPQTILLFVLDLKQRNKPHSVLGYYKSLKRFFNWLVEEEVLGSSPMAKIKSPKVPALVIEPLSSGQIKDLLLCCDDNTFSGARNKAIILMFLDTGLRLSELANIQLADIDIDRETIKVMGKGYRERVVRIGTRTQRALLRYILMRKDNQPYLWVSEATSRRLRQKRPPLSASAIRQMIVKTGKRARIEGVRCSPHTLRHTFATRALLCGAGEFNVQSLLGHSDLRMTRRYTATLRSEQAVEAHRGDKYQKGFSPVDNMK